MNQETHTAGLPIEFGGCEFILLPERAMWWPDEQTLFVADLHFGKDATFRAAGIPIPCTLQRDLARLSHIIEDTEPQRVIVLGDLLHARDGRSAEVVDTVAQWRSQFTNLELMLVRGNHDRHAGDPPSSWNIDCINAPTLHKSLTLIHRPTFREATATLAGHLHPKFRLRRGADDLRLPCFLRRANTLVLPAFSGFVDHDTISPRPGDSIYVVADSNVIAI